MTCLPNHSCLSVSSLRKHPWEKIEKEPVNTDYLQMIISFKESWRYLWLLWTVREIEAILKPNLPIKGIMYSPGRALPRIISVAYKLLREALRWIWNCHNGFQSTPAETLGDAPYSFHLQGVFSRSSWIISNALHYMIFEHYLGKLIRKHQKNLKINFLPACENTV